MARSKPITIPISRQALAEFFSRVRVSQTHFLKNDPCWDWTGAPEVGGYAQFSVRQRKYKGHRVSFTWFRGEIPEGLVLDHLCRNRLCVNPAHLEIVTIGVNVLRGETIPVQLAARSTCGNGHEFTPENTSMKLDKSGKRYRTCKECHRARGRKYWTGNLDECHDRRRRRRLIRKSQGVGER